MAVSVNVGSLSETSKDLATLNKRAHQIMSRNLVCLKRGASIVDAVKIFNENCMSCIPVVDNDNKPVGIISWRDSLKALKESWAKHLEKSKT